MTEAKYLQRLRDRNMRPDFECKLHNFFLTLKYPFLKMGSDYSYTYLDDMPDGWRLRFGIEMCENIKAQLLEEGSLHTYKVFQVKEKFGSLRWYDNGSVAVQDIVEQYSSMSLTLCVKCGKEASWLTTGWIVPLCHECKRKEEESSPHPKVYHLL